MPEVGLWQLELDPSSLPLLQPKLMDDYGTMCLKPLFQDSHALLVWWPSSNVA